MDRELPIAALIRARLAVLQIKRAEIVRRIGFKNVSKGLRRLDALCHGDLSVTTKFITHNLAAALDLSPDAVKMAIDGTADQLAERERLRLEEEDRAYRARFRPHVLWVTENSRPSWILGAALVGIEKLLRIDLDVEQGEATFVSQALAALPSGIAFFGKVVGFTVNFTPDSAQDFDAHGNLVATYSKARRPPWADATLKNGQSLVGLIHVETEPAAEERPDSVLH